MKLFGLKRRFWARSLGFLGAVLTTSASAQIFTTLHEFAAVSGSASNNIDGATPLGQLVLAGGALYGTTSSGGSNGNGTVFRMNVDGSAFTNLHDFSSITYLFANRDGAKPQAGLILSNDVLYGTTELGGTNATGAVFALNTNGLGFYDVYNFPLLAGVFNPLNAGGAQPHAAIAMVNDVLYGTTPTGGHNTFGTLFSVKTNGSIFTSLHDFTALGKFFPNANSDGNAPVSPLIASGNVLYGTSPVGGTNGTGTIFKINSDGTGFVTLHSFAGLPISGTTNSEGATPLGSLLLVNGALFGTASNGGTNGSGTIFSIHTDGSSFTNLYNFTNNVDGANPQSGVIEYGGFLCGTTANGGSNSDGAIFTINPSGYSFKAIYNFTGGDDGAHPNGLVASNNALYGTTSGGGTNNTGVIFQLSLHPDFFAGEFTLSNSVYYLVFPGTLNLFGFYNYRFFPYFYHYDLGFEYFINAEDDDDGAYFYDFITGDFWYTSPSAFPYLYDFTLNSWIYYFPDPNNPGHYTTNPRYFYNFATEQIFTNGTQSVRPERIGK